MLEDDESKMPLKFQAGDKKMETRRVPEGVEGREQDMVDLVLDLEIGDGGICT